VRRHLAAAATLVLAACATPELAPPPGAAEFELAGRVAVKYRDEALTANLAWRHAADADDMLLTSALGQGIARIARRSNETTLTTPEPKEYRAADPETLTEQALGFRLPLAGLADWVRGRAAPGPAQARRDAHGRLLELEQSGWRIEYLEYEGERPARMRLSYPGVELRLAISAWK
jgi:outer membrane lipoprotein LolB